MKVSKVVSGKSVAAASKKKKVDAGSGAEFAGHLQEAAAVTEASATTGAGSVNSVDAILSVQESPDATSGRSRGLTMGYANDLLDHLEDLRRDLLLGVVPKEKLGGMAQKMRAQRRLTDDAKLNEIIDEVELRAEVEIAKLTR